jgi:hypothetical protein
VNPESAHLILHPVEAPAAELDAVFHVEPVPSKRTVPSIHPMPLQFIRCCAPGSIRVVAVTPTDVPCLCTASVYNGSQIKLKVKPLTKHQPFPTSIAIHLIGRARTSPPAWERHSRQQFVTNRRIFGRALP